MSFAECMRPAERLLYGRVSLTGSFLVVLVRSCHSRNVLNI